MFLFEFWLQRFFFVITREVLFYYFIESEALSPPPPLMVVSHYIYMIKKPSLSLRENFTKFLKQKLDYCYLQEHGNQHVLTPYLCITRHHSVVSHSQHFTIPPSHLALHAAVDAEKQTKPLFNVQGILTTC